nr:endo alpha-1,4 polygalactosaminidase [Nocardioides convexus]
MFAALALTLALALTPAVTPPPPGGDVDYRTGGAVTPVRGVDVVVRDRTARPAAGRYNVCYVNAFQTQPDAAPFWRRHWSLVLRRGGRPVADEAWGEWLLDIRTPAKRAALARIVGPWIDGCARSGYDAVETRQPRLLVAQPRAGDPGAGQGLRPHARPAGAPAQARGRPEELVRARRHHAGLRLRGGRGVRALRRVRGLRGVVRQAGAGDRVPPR